MAIVLKNNPLDSKLLISALKYFEENTNKVKFEPKVLATDFYRVIKNKEGEIEKSEIIFGFPLIWRDDVLVNERELTEQNEYIYSTLNIFLQEIKQLAIIDYVKSGGGFTRMAVPPKEAYEYKGHNKLDIKPSKIASALLYED